MRYPVTYTTDPSLAGRLDATVDYEWEDLVAPSELPGLIEEEGGRDIKQIDECTFSADFETGGDSETRYFVLEFDETDTPGLLAAYPDLNPWLADKVVDSGDWTVLHGVEENGTGQARLIRCDLHEDEIYWLVDGAEFSVWANQNAAAKRYLEILAGELIDQ